MEKSNIYAFVGTGKEDGIIAIGLDAHVPAFPMVFMSRRMAKKFYPMVKGYCDAKGHGFALLKYENPADITPQMHKELREEGFKY